MDYLPNARNNTRTKSSVVSVAIITNDDKGRSASSMYSPLPFYIQDVQYDFEKFLSLFLKIDNTHSYINIVTRFIKTVASLLYLLFTGLYHYLLALGDRRLTLATYEQKL